MPTGDDHAQVELPRALREGIVRTPEGAAWAARLPELVGRARVRWGLRIGEPFSPGSAAWTAPARDASGRDLVLKLVCPHEEARHEATALGAWSGRGAVEVVATAGQDWAMLLERLRPGTPLTQAAGSALDRVRRAARTHRWLVEVPVSAPGVPTMVEVCTEWACLIEERADQAAHVRARRTGPAPALDAGIVAAAATALRTLPAESSRQVLVHGDFNPGNLLVAADGGLRVIDPKPLLGDPAYDPWPILEQVGSRRGAGSDGRTHPTLTQLTVSCAAFADESGLDPGRIAAWALARSVEAALWSWAVGDSGAPGVAAAERHLARAAHWAGLAG